MSEGSPAILQPPIAALVERESVLFDFGTLMAANYPGTTISSIIAVNVTVLVGTDATPGDRLLGNPAIVASQRTPAIAAGAVLAWFGSMIGGVTYVLQAVVQLSDGKSRPSIEVQLPCYDPNVL